MPEQVKDTATTNDLEQASDTKDVVITEEQLQKALNDLEGVKPAEKKPQVTVQPIQLTGDAMSTIQQLLGERLKKSMVSNTDLNEITQLLGTHVDRNLSIIAKSIDAAKQRDDSVIRLLESITKSLTVLEKTLGKAMDEPVASATQTGVTMADVVQKNDSENTTKQQDPQMLKKSIVDGLSHLIRSETIGSQEGQRLTDVMIQFETGGNISDADIKKALKTVEEG